MLARKMILGVALLICIAFVFPVLATTYYVDPNGDDDANGLSWGMAFATVQKALDSVSYGDGIWVAEGTYKPTKRTDPCDQRSVTFQLAVGVIMYGGFEGVETDPNQRDWQAHETILSGDIDNDGILNSNNCYHVVAGANDVNAIIDGFTVMNGYANGLNPANRGGGIFFNAHSGQTIRNCVISNNYASNCGGGIYLSTFTNYSSKINNCTITNNKALWDGGGIFSSMGDPDINGCTISNNEVNQGYGGGQGGGMGFNNASPTGNSKITNCIFKDNRSDYGGGGIYLSEGSVNRAFKLEIRNCVFTGNYASTMAGALQIFTQFNSPNDLTITNCVFSKNTTRRLGGAIYNYCSSPTITNCTFVENSATYLTAKGGAIYNDYHNYGPASPALTNCILWGNYAVVDGNEIYNETGCNPTFGYCDITGGLNGINCGGVDSTDRGGNIDIDPCFVDADDNDFHLSIHSRCIDKGDSNGNYNDLTDIDGEMRVFGGRVDMGVDEAWWPTGHWWMLDEVNGVTAYDSVDTNNGIFNGSDPNWTGNGVDFNGVSDYFSIPDLNRVYGTATNFTIAGWFRTSQSTGIQTIVGSWLQTYYSPYPGVDMNMYSGWQILVENNKVVARFATFCPVPSDITGTSNVTDGSWHYFAITYPSYPTFTPVLYVDGQAEGTPGTEYFGLSDTKFRIGDGSYVISSPVVLKGGAFCGTIDDVMIFNRALTEDEVWQLYLAGQ